MPKINFNEDQVLESFVHQMVVDKGLAEEDRNQNGKIQHELMEQLNEAIEKAMIAALPDAQLIELNRLLEAGASDEEVMKVFETAGVDFELAAGKAMAEFRQKYVGEGKTTMAEQSPAGRPLQGESSEVPGKSDVEGIAQNGEER